MSDDYYPLMPNTILTLIGDEKLFLLVIWYNKSQKPMISENALSYLIYYCSHYNQISNTLLMRTVDQAGWSVDDLNHFPNYNAKTFAAFLIYLKILVSLKILLVNVGYFSSNVSNICFIQIMYHNNYKIFLSAYLIHNKSSHWS